MKVYCKHFVFKLERPHRVKIIVLTRSALVIIGMADAIGGCHMSIESLDKKLPGCEELQHRVSEELHPMLGNTGQTEDRGKTQLLPNGNLE